LTLDLIAREGDVMAAARQFNARANVEDIANGPFGNHQMRLILHNQILNRLRRKSYGTSSTLR
jgi:hypothetical protein